MFNSIMNYFGNQTEPQSPGDGYQHQNQTQNQSGRSYQRNEDAEQNQICDDSKKQNQNKNKCSEYQSDKQQIIDNLMNQDQYHKCENKQPISGNKLKSCDMNVGISIDSHATARPSWSGGCEDYGISSVITPEGKQIIVNYQDNTIRSHNINSYSNPNGVNNINQSALIEKNTIKSNNEAHDGLDKTVNNMGNAQLIQRNIETLAQQVHQHRHHQQNSNAKSHTQVPNQIQSKQNPSIQQQYPNMFNNQLNQQKMKKQKTNKNQATNSQNTINSVVNQLVNSGTREPQKIQSHLNSIQSSLSSLKNSQSFNFEVISANQSASIKKPKKSKQDGDDIESIEINNATNCQKASNSASTEEVQQSDLNDDEDPITGVLKRRINKGNKRTKGVSLTLNPNNIQQLMQMLQQHSNQQNDASAPQQLMKQELKSQSDIDSNQQALNLIMQLITNNSPDGLGKTNSGTGQPGGECPKIDPQLLEQLFCIDQEEEECTDSDEDQDDDNENDSSNEDGDDLDDMEADDDEPNEDEDIIDDEDEDDEYGEDEDQYDNEDNEYGDEDLYDDEDEVIQDEAQSFNQKIINQNQLNHHLSSDEQATNDNHLDLLSLENAKQNDTNNQKQLKKGISHSQKQFAEDMNQSCESYDSSQDNENNVTLECGEQFYDQNTNGQGSKTKGPVAQGKDGGCQQQQNQETTTIDGDNSSQYEDVGDINDAQTSSFDQEETDYSTSTSQSDNIAKLLKQKLKVSDKLSPQFHRFYENFSQNVNFIIQYEYNILPQQKSYQNYQGQSHDQQDLKARDTAQLILKKKYNNLRKLCEHNCKCFTGPHSVLQIFIEKIVQAIESFACKLKGLTRDELQLWVENDLYAENQAEEKNLNELNYSINGIDLNLIFKMQSMSKKCLAYGVSQGIKDGIKEEIKQIHSDSDNSMKQDSQVQSTLKYIEQNTKSEEAKQKLRQLGQMSDNQIKNLVQMASDYLKQKQSSQKFKPLLKNLPNYTQFLQNIICHYNLIIKQYAPNISRHFTEMTQVIKEGNKYEFPSQDIHRTILNKLIINDSGLFKHFFYHIKSEYSKHEKAIKKKIQVAQSALNNGEGGPGSQLSKTMQNYIKFIEVFECFTKDVEQDINKGVSLLNIDFYMRDLRKHALKEYNEVMEIEQAFLSMNEAVCKQLAEAEKNQASAIYNKQYELLKQDKSSIKRIYTTADLEPNQLKQYNDLLNERYGFIISNSNDLEQQALDGSNDDLQQQIFDFNMLDSKEKKKLKKKQRKRDKKIKQQMAQHGLLPESETDKAGANEPSVSPNRHDESGGSLDQQAINGQEDSISPPKQGQDNDQSQKNLQRLQALAPKGMYYCPQCKQFHTGNNPNAENLSNDANDFQEKSDLQHHDGSELAGGQPYGHSQSMQKRRKGKNGGKLSQEEMKKLTTDELVSYIENEGKKKDKLLREDGQEASAFGLFSAESNKIQQMRAKAKAFVEKQKTNSEPNQINSNSKQRLDPNNFTCKFCNGSIDPATLRFVHENFCLVGNSRNQSQKLQQLSNQKKKSIDNNQSKGRNTNIEQDDSNYTSATLMGEESTQGSNSHRVASGQYTTNDAADDDYNNFDEDQKIEEFARKLELIQKMPNRYQGSGGQRRRRKLKPNISKDWVNKLRKQLKSQQHPVKNLSDRKQSLNIDGVSNSSESVGSYASSSNSNSNGKKMKIPNQYNSQSSFAKKKGRLSDLSTDQIKIQMQDHPEAQSRKDASANTNQSKDATTFDKDSFNPKNFNQSMPAAQNRKKLQANSNQKVQK